MRISDGSSDVCSSDLTDLDHVRFRILRTAALRGRRPGGDRPEGPAARDACGRSVGGTDTRHGAAFPFRRRRDDPRSGAGGTSEEMAGGKRSDHGGTRSEEHTSELQSLMRISYAVFCLKKKKSTGQMLQLTST